MIEQQKQKEPVLCCRGTECSRSLPPSLARSALRPQGCFDISATSFNPLVWRPGRLDPEVRSHQRGVSHPSVKGGLVKSCICVFLHCGVVLSSVCLSDLRIVVCYMLLFVFLLPSASSLGLCVSFQIQFQFQFILVRRDSTY